MQKYPYIRDCLNSSFKDYIYGKHLEIDDFSNLGTTNFKGNIKPSSTVTYDLGSNENIWKTLYVKDIKMGGAGSMGTFDNACRFSSSLLPVTSRRVDIGDSNDNDYWDCLYVRYGYFKNDIEAAGYGEFGGYIKGASISTTGDASFTGALSAGDATVASLT